MTTGDIIRVPLDTGRHRIFRVVGVFLGGHHQESVVELETLDLKATTQGRMCVPVDILRLVNGDGTECEQWQAYAQYCRKCAIVGEKHPMDFADFTQGD